MASSTTNDDEAIPQPSIARLTFVMIGICLAVFLTGMDQTILATAIPVISVEFNTSSDFGWWSNAYLLTLSAFQIFYGRLYSLFPIKHVYLIAIIIFEIGSLVCTTAPTSVALIIGRAIAGLGAAGVFSGSVLITTKLIPLAQRAAYLGIMSASFGLAAVIGPFLGAAILESTTWRWCFGINLPLGAVTVVLCSIFVHTPTHSDVQSLTLYQRIWQLDIPGTILMAGSLISLLMALQWGGATYPWDDGRVIALFVVSGVLAVGFLATQMTTLTGQAHTFPRSLTHNRDIWLADVRGHSPLSSSELLTPVIGGYVVASIVAGAITSAFKYYNPAMILGTALAVTGSALFTTIALSSSLARVIGYQLVLGFGAGFAFGQPSYVVQTLLPIVDVPMGVTFITLSQNLSASISVAVAQAIFQGSLHTHLAPLLPPSSNSSLLLSDIPTILSSMPADTKNEGKRVVSDSIIRTFYLCLALSCASVVGALFIKWVPMRDSSTKPSPSSSVDLQDQTSTPKLEEKSECT